MTMVEAAVELDKVAFYWSADFTPSEAVDFLQKAKEQSVSNQELVAFVEAITTRIDAMRKDTKFKVSHMFRIGNYGSREIVIEIYKVALSDDFDYKKLSGFLKSLSQIARADEYEERLNNSFRYQYRVWWD